MADTSIANKAPIAPPPVINMKDTPENSLDIIKFCRWAITPVAVLVTSVGIATGLSVECCINHYNEDFIDPEHIAQHTKEQSFMGIVGGIIAFTSAKVVEVLVNKYL